MTRKTYTQRAPEPLAKTLLLWIWIMMSANAASMITSLVVIGAALFGGGDASMSLLQFVDGGVTLLYVAVFIIAGFLGLKWTYRVSMNANAMVPDLTISPPWAVGWYFVPIASLFTPFKAMEEAWKASSDPTDWRSVPTPGWMRVWWAFWIAGTFIDQASGNMDASYGDTALIVTGEAVGLLGSALNLVASFYFAKLVRELTARQSSIRALEVF
ncbi:DUF4328 domain-containing protein [Caulobacter sp. 602-2]|uniref:DUF4328 domain-containing protein n=1 Tax=Caulobacter sp. 602-2 TaxID=2710887 RepID=A0A6G4QY25_9CAUL|nr:DUF4328 domain-containing protein [Caulobacter sp. 602-2]NGM50441.1 DUF4328 domain-containing protein [Caulobacter sp. 602-2]